MIVFLVILASLLTGWIGYQKLIIEQLKDENKFLNEDLANAEIEISRNQVSLIWEQSTNRILSDRLKDAYFSLELALNDMLPKIPELPRCSDSTEELARILEPTKESV